MDESAGGPRRPKFEDPRGAERQIVRAVVGVIRIVHPFPSLLDGAVTAALVLIAGGPAAIAGRLGIAMVALQFAIGTANDLADEPLDRRAKPDKPLARGLLSRRAATALFLALAAIGLGLSAVSGPAVFAVATAGTAVGLVYDRWLKGTLWSWLPFAAGIPLLPVYAWLGATDRLPTAFVVLVPTAVVAGSALAIANLLADADRDRAAGVETVATRLGVVTAWRVSVALYAVVATVALLSVLLLRGRGVGLVALLGGAVVIGVGLALSRVSEATRRERGWELQAGGVGLLAAGWVGALADAGSL